LKLHAERTPHLNTVTAYGSGFVEVNHERHTASLLLTPDLAPRPWPVTDFAQIDAASLAAAQVPGCEVLLVGTGRRQRFVHPRVTTLLTARGMGVEFMDTAAACRTYNVLMGEGRRVAAALIIEETLP